MQKNISLSINEIKNREIYEINCLGTVESEIEITLSTVEFPSVEYCSTNQIKIPKSVITSKFDKLINRKIVISGSELLNIEKNDVQFEILEASYLNDDIILTLNTEFVVKRRIPEVPEVPEVPEQTIDPVPPETEPTIIPAIPSVPAIPEYIAIENELTVFIERDIQLETELNYMLNLLLLPNSNVLTQSDIATCNDFFAKNELMCTTLLQHSSAYKDENLFNERIGEVNNFMKKDISLLNRDDLIIFKNEIIQTINLVNKLHRDVSQYYDDIKKLIVKFKLSDLIISGK